MNIKIYIQYVIALWLTSHAAWASKDLDFKVSCQGQTMTIAAVGDFLLHRPLQAVGQNEGFDALWSVATPYFAQADLVFGNLEGPIAEGMYSNGRINKQNPNAQGIYTGYPLFNYPPKLAQALKKTHVDLVSIANNHALDRGSKGLNKTLEILDKAQIKTTGVRQSHSQQPRHQIMNVNGFKLAWIGCAEHTNGLKDKHDQVAFCFSDKAQLLKNIRRIKSQVDAVIVVPHWGQEYNSQPNSRQKKLAREFLDAGALAVIGSHPHVLQPIEKYVTKDGRETLIAYSLGNFVSYQGSANKRASLILLITLEKTQSTAIQQVRFVPLYMQNRQGLAKLRLTIPNALSKYHTQAILPKYRIGSGYSGPCR